MPALDVAFGLFKEKLPKKQNAEINSQMSLPIREAVKNFMAACESVSVKPLHGSAEGLTCEWSCDEVAKLFEAKCSEFGKESSIR